MTPQENIGAIEKWRNSPFHDRIFAFEHEMLKLPQLSLPLFHHFAPGIYARELHIPKGVITTGKIHKYACLNIMAKGERSTLVGDEIVRVKAPFIHVAPAGTKRVSYTHEDSVWITVHATEETDIVKLEKDLIAETEKEYLDFLNAVKAIPELESICLS
jgi:hypothetical protein